MSTFLNVSRTAVVGVAMLAGLGLSGCSGAADSVSDVGSSADSAVESFSGPAKKLSPAASPTSKSSGNASVVAALNALPVKGRAPKTGYNRDQFGPAWKDMDRNGCDTRNDILKRDLVDETFKNGSKCVVATGTLTTDPYTGKTIVWTRGQNTSSAIQIDHVVALSNAWQTGAQQWSLAKRETFGNDPLNLIAADGPANMAKGDGDAATWLPPNKAYRCKYVANQIAVKKKYGLWVTSAEKDAMARILQSCSTTDLPAGGLPVPN